LAARTTVRDFAQLAVSAHAGRQLIPKWLIPAANKLLDVKMQFFTSMCGVLDLSFFNKG
jgi:hypothetical protein